MTTAFPTARWTVTAGPIAAFISLEVRRALRNRRYVMLAIAIPVVFYILYTGVIAGDTADPNAQVGGLAWRTYFMISMASYAAIGAALGGAVVIAGERQSGWTRQLRVTPLPPVAYIGGKLLVSYIVTVPAIAAVLLAGVAVDHVTMSIPEWILLLGVLAIGALPFAALGLLIGYLFDGNSAQGASMISLFGLAILGGLWAPISSFPDDLATIGRVLPSFRLADIGRDAASGLLPDGLDIAILALYAVVIGGLAVWRYRSSEQRTSG